VVGVVAASVAAFAVVQFASDAFYARAAAAGTLPRRISLTFARSVYRALDHLAPAPYVEESLADDALERGDAGAAQRYALRLPASPVRDELLARAALMRGQLSLAREYFLAAPDPRSVASAAQSLALRDPAAAYALERELRLRLAVTGTHPDEVAQAWWEMGGVANRQAWREVPGSALQRAWLKRGLHDFDASVAVAPLSERYVISAANQADLLGERRRARELFERASAIDPDSADAIAGLGVVAWEDRDRYAAGVYLARARSLDPQALMVRALERDLR
jgi:tetratricopeptide (TPR) repeat protein